MDDLALAATLLAAVPLGLLARAAWRRFRRRRLLAAPFPAEFEAVLERRVPLWRAVPEELKARARARANVLLGEKTWEGAGGLELTDEVRVAIAGQAALLLLGRDPAYFSELESVVVHPTAYLVHTTRDLGGELVEEDEEEWSGESWGQGTVVLAWEDVLRTGGWFPEGFNVVLHEFAHQLDAESGADDGLPVLPDRALYERWPGVMTAAFDALRAATDAGRRDVLDDYALEDPAEFFAVATETFFEAGPRLAAAHPELYGVLREYYAVDPATWVRPPEPARERRPKGKKARRRAREHASDSERFKGRP